MCCLLTAECGADPGDSVADTGVGPDMGLLEEVGTAGSDLSCSGGWSGADRIEVASPTHLAEGPRL